MDAYIEDSAFSDAIRMTVLKIDLDVDTDRNGIVDDSDEQGEDRWHNSRGAFFNVNFDRDGTRTIHGEPRPDAIHFDDSGNAVDEDYFIENDIDALDIAPLVIRRIRPVVPQGYSVYLKTADIQDVQRIHVYKAIRSPNAVEGDANEAIWGSMTRPETRSEIDITRWVNPSTGNNDFQGEPGSGDATFGIEGLSFRNTGMDVLASQMFDGYVNLSLELRNGGGDILASDTVCMKVAPWMSLPPQTSVQAVYVRDCGENNKPFRESTSADPGYFGLDRSGVMQTISRIWNDNSQWMQDHVEIGFTQRPGGPVQYVAFRLPYMRGRREVNPIWPVRDFLGRDCGVFQIGRDARIEDENVTKGYGGNLETTLPSEHYPLGRIVLGDISLMPKRLVAFLRSQEVQMSALSITVNWLLVGHVDEAVSFLEDGRIAIVSPKRALELLEVIPEPLRWQCVFFAKGATPETGITSSDSSVNMRMETGLDLRESPWKYVRIVSGPNAGTVGKIETLGDGFLTVSTVFRTTSKIVNGNPPDYDYSHWTWNEEHDSCPILASWMPAAGERYVLCEDSLLWDYGMPAIITVKELLEDGDFAELCMRFENSEIHDIKTRLEAEIPMVEFVEMPGLFLANFQGTPSSATIKNAHAFNPNPVNMQNVNREFYFPRQFGPVRNGHGDVFEEEILNLFGGLSFFVDDWKEYHILEGEVHCGSAVKRRHPVMPWWESLQ